MVQLELLLLQRVDQLYIKPFGEWDVIKVHV